MVQVGAYQHAAGYYNNTVDRKEKQQTDRFARAEKTQTAGYVDKSKEQVLSRQAQNVLEKLRDKYGDMDFMVVDFWYRAVGKRLPCSAVMKCNNISHPNTSISHHKVREKPLFADIIYAWLM